MSTLRAPRRRKAFTLIEILVVLAIAAVITSITVGGFKEMGAGNKRVSCQSNLAQIYQSCRMYASDEGGKFPFYGSVSANKVVDCAAPGNNTGIGLWALYTFPAANFKDPAAVGSAPIERYIRSDKVLHCPSDLDSAHSLYDPADATKYNDKYLSYQACDDNKTPLDLSDDVAAYSSTRTNDDSVANQALWQRQLLTYNASGNLVSRPPADTTVVAWCQFHRETRNMDNVLFYDGSVQLLPNQGASANWSRVPKPPQ